MYQDSLIFIFMKVIKILYYTIKYTPLYSKTFYTIHNPLIFIKNMRLLLVLLRSFFSSIPLPQDILVIYHMSYTYYEHYKVKPKIFAHICNKAVTFT